MDDEEEGEEVDFHAIAAEENDPLDVDPFASSNAGDESSRSPHNNNDDGEPRLEAGDVAEIQPEAASPPTPHDPAQNTQSELFSGDPPATSEEVCSPAGTLPMVPSHPVKPRRIEPAALDKLKDEDFR